MCLALPAIWSLSQLRSSACEAHKQLRSSGHDGRGSAAKKLVMDPALPFHTISMCHETFFFSFFSTFSHRNTTLSFWLYRRCWWESFGLWISGLVIPDVEAKGRPNLCLKHVCRLHLCCLCRILPLTQPERLPPLQS